LFQKFIDPKQRAFVGKASHVDSPWGHPCRERRRIVPRGTRASVQRRIGCAAQKNPQLPADGIGADNRQRCAADQPHMLDQFVGGLSFQLGGLRR